MRIALASLLLSITGAAAAHTLSGTVLDAETRPAAGAQVWLIVARDPQVAMCDDAGRFSFAEVPTGSVQLLAFKDGFALGGISGQCIDDTTLEIHLMPPVSTRLRVINTKFEPVEGAALARLEIPGVFNVFVQDLTAFGFPSIRSDAEGFLPLPPMPHDAFISVSISHPAYADGVLPALPAGEDIDLPLPDGVALAGRVADSSGAGVDRARVLIYRPQVGASVLLATEVLSGRDGFYSTRVPPGKYFVAAQHPRHAMPSPKAVLADTFTTQAILDLTFPAPHRLHGHAVDGGGLPVSLAKFSYRADDYFVAETVSDARGQFEMLVPAGDGSLHIVPPRRMTPETPRINLRIGEEPELEIEQVRFFALPELQGKVSTRDDAAPGLVLITSRNLDPPLVVTTNDAGEFVLSLEAVPEEPLRFRAEHALRFQRRDFEIDPVKLTLSDVHLRDFRPEEPEVIRWPNNLKGLVGQPAPELDCRAWINLPDGHTALRLSDLRGKVVVLFLWAGFDRSPRSVQRIAEMTAAHRLYQDTPDVAIVSVHDAAATPELISAYIDELGIPFPVGHDVEASTTFSAYNTGFVPQTVFIDKKGTVRFYTGEEKLLELVKLLRRE